MPAASTPPADLALRYEWREGSVPPPYHYEYTVRLGPGGQGEVVFRPDYAQHDPPVWTEAFSVPGEALAGLYALLAEAGVFTRRWRRSPRLPIGGSTAWLEATAGGRTVTVPAGLAQSQAAAIGAVYEAIRGLVPGAIWAKLLARRDDYRRAHAERT